jgi:hypothetical protein
VGVLEHLVKPTTRTLLFVALSSRAPIPQLLVQQYEPLIPAHAVMRGVAEALEHERYLYLAAAGPTPRRTGTGY